MYFHDLEVMSSKPSQVELGCVVLLSQIILERNIYLVNVGVLLEIASLTKQVSSRDENLGMQCYQSCLCTHFFHVVLRNEEDIKVYEIVIIF